MKKGKEWLKEEVKGICRGGHPTLGAVIGYVPTIDLIDQLDEQTKITLNDVITRLDGLEKDNRLSWISKILHNFKMEYDDSKYQSGYEQGKVDGVAELQEKYTLAKKPVVPQFVADYIEKWEHEGFTIYEWFSFDNNDVDEDVNKWLYNNTIGENRRREFLLMDAIRYGYEVEKEKLYHVLNKENYFMLRKYGGLVDIMQVSSKMSRDEFGKDTRFMLTEKEIKDYDERYWAFAEEVTE